MVGRKWSLERFLSSWPFNSLLESAVEAEDSGDAIPSSSISIASVPKQLSIDEQIQNVKKEALFINANLWFLIRSYAFSGPWRDKLSSTPPPQQLITFSSRVLMTSWCPNLTSTPFSTLELSARAYPGIPCVCHCDNGCLSDQWSAGKIITIVSLPLLLTLCFSRSFIL